MSALRDAVLLLSRAVDCLSAALDAEGVKRTMHIAEADVCAAQAREIANTEAV